MTTPMLFERHDGRGYSSHILNVLDERVSTLKADQSSPFSMISHEFLYFEYGYLPFREEVTRYLETEASQHFDPDTIGRFVTSPLYETIMNFETDFCDKGSYPPFVSVSSLIHLTSMPIPITPKAQRGAYRYHLCDEHNPRSRKNPSPSFPLLTVGTNEMHLLVRDVNAGKATIDKHLPVSLFEALSSPTFYLAKEVFDFTVREYINLATIRAAYDHTVPVSVRAGRFDMAYHRSPSDAIRDLEAVRQVAPEGLALLWFYIAGMGERGHDMTRILPAVEYASSNLSIEEAYLPILNREIPKLRTLVDFHKRGIGTETAARVVGKITPAALSKAMKSGMDIDLILGVYDAA